MANTNDATITQTVEPQAGALIPLTGEAAKTATLTASATQESIAGGVLPFGWPMQGQYAALPPIIDDIEAELRDDMYVTQMRHDPQVASCSDTLVNGILASGFTLSPSVPDKIKDATGKSIPNPDFAEADKWHRLVSYSFGRIGLIGVSRQMLAAIWEGYKVAEIVYEAGTGEWAGQYVHKAIKPKPRRAVALVVDTFGNIVGGLGYLLGYGGYGYSGYGYGGYAGSGLGLASWGFGARAVDLEKTPHLLPREKFFILTHAPKDSDPRGTSLFRRVYRAWWDKQQIITTWLQYLALFGGPRYVGYTAPEAGVSYGVDGNSASPQAKMLASLEQLRFGAVAVFANGATVEQLDPAGNGEAFTNALAIKDREIAKGILGSTLATEQAEKGQRAAAETQSDMLGDGIAGLRTWLEEAVRCDLVLPLLRLNGCPDPEKYAPRFALSDTGRQDLPDMMNATANLEKSGFLTPSQKVALAPSLHLPVPEPDEIAQMTQGTQAQTDPNQNDLNDDDPTDPKGDESGKFDPYKNDADKKKKANDDNE